MSSQVDVRSVDALKDFRAALALYADDTLAALGAVDAEVKRTVRWLQDDRPAYWQDQLRRRREAVASAKAEIFRRKLQKTADNSPSMAEPVETLRRAEASVQDAEKRLALVRKWQQILPQTALEFRASTRRINTIASVDVPRATGLLGRLIDALERYRSLTPPTASVSDGTLGANLVGSIASGLMDQEPTEPDIAVDSAEDVETHPGPPVQE